VTPANSRSVALAALAAVEDGAFANLTLPKLLESSELERRDRDFATGLVYGVTRMRRALDWLISLRVDRPIEPEVRNLLRLGLFQLRWMDVPDHAAVSETVDLAPPRARGFVNAVLRRSAGADPGWPDLPTELSYPDWIFERLVADFGEADATDALRRMNQPPPVTVRQDGYVQDLASQWVAAAAGAELPPGGVAYDLAAAPGGKATALASRAGTVVAADLQPHRVRLISSNVRRLGLTNVSVMVADGKRPALAPESAGLVLVDAPCSGLGALRRRPDARWRIQARDVANLAALQARLVDSAAALVAPGGVLAYSACTMTEAETLGIDRHLEKSLAAWEPKQPQAGEWRAHGRGSLVLPHDHDTDGMFLLLLRRPT
jgi:16S rRNA (cytosine967-C5)-methyltransferase